MKQTLSLVLDPHAKLFHYVNKSGGVYDLTKKAMSGSNDGYVLNLFLKCVKPISQMMGTSGMHVWEACVGGMCGRHVWEVCVGGNAGGERRGMKWVREAR